RDFVSILLAPVRHERSSSLSAAGRGLLYQVEQGLGTASALAVADQVRDLNDEDRAILDLSGIVVGRCMVFAPVLLDRASIDKRAALAFAWLGRRVPTQSPAGALSFHPLDGVSDAVHLALGYPVFAGRAVRTDLAERVARALAAPDHAPPEGFGGWLG